MTTTKNCKIVFQFIWFSKAKKKKILSFFFFHILCLIPQAKRPMSSANFQLLHLCWNCFRLVSCCMRMLWLRSCWRGPLYLFDCNLPSKETIFCFLWWMSEINLLCRHPVNERLFKNARGLSMVNKYILKTTTMGLNKKHCQSSITQMILKLYWTEGTTRVMVTIQR